MELEKGSNTYQKSRTKLKINECFFSCSYKSNDFFLVIKKKEDSSKDMRGYNGRKGINKYSGLFAQCDKMAEDQKFGFWRQREQTKKN